MISRRGLLRSAVQASAAAAVCQLAVPAVHAAGGESGRPNLLFLCTDQQHWQMMSCAGNRYLKTPHMDSLAATGVRFSASYATNPVCVPSRASFYSGVMPSQLNISSNDNQQSTATPEILANGAGHLLTNAGYEVAFAGKQHLPRCMTMASIGFTNILTKDERDGCADLSAEFIRRKHDRPWFLVTSLINPHDICYAAIRAHPEKTQQEQMLVNSGKVETATLDKAMQRPAGVDDATFWRDLCPPLPGNYQPLADEPEAIKDYLAERPFMAWVRKNWTDQDWRMHRWAYHRLTEMVDAQIGRVLAALRQSGQEENTVVIFTSDHGDNDSSRKTEHKSLPYDESARIPFIVSQPGRTRAGAVDQRLVCNGLDLVPTLCDYAGIKPPAHMRGRSVRPLAEGRDSGAWRQTLVVETEVSRLIRDGRYKYIVFSHGANRFQLFDLQSDPLEKVNLIDAAELAPVRQRLHAELARSIHEIGDPFGRQYVEGA
jgi:choline-sulfatase